MAKRTIKLIGAERFSCRPAGIEALEKGKTFTSSNEEQIDELLTRTYIDRNNVEWPLFTEDLNASPVHGARGVRKGLVEAVKDGSAAKDHRPRRTRAQPEV